LSILSRIRLAYPCYFSKPQSDRPVYRAIQRSRARKIVELGVATGRRALRMIEVAKLASPGQEVHYVGLDPFEGRSESDGPGLTLKAAHQLLRRDGVRVQLIPGNLADSLVRVANSLGKVDLLIVPAMLDSASFARAWLFVPRMLHEQSLVFIERTLESGQALLEIKPRCEIDALASISVRRQAA
jgi:hypothetical protein